MSNLELSRVAAAVAGLSELAVLATLVKVEGSSYRRPGARLLWFSNGYRIGGISGGCLEADLIERCPEVLRTGTASLVIYDTSKESDILWGSGMGCQGTVSILLERVDRNHVLADLAQAGERTSAAAITVAFEATAPEESLGHRSLTTLESGSLESVGGRSLRARQNLWTTEAGATYFVQFLPPAPLLVICGAGEDARVLVQQAIPVGWQVWVLDPRSELLSPERFPRARLLAEVSDSDWLGGLEIPEHASVVIMSHHYRYDLPWLKALMNRRLSYLGLLGPKKRGERLLADLANESHVMTAEYRKHFHSPMGLDLGGDGPEAIALSVLAEIQGVLHARSSKALREKTAPVNE